MTLCAQQHTHTEQYSQQPGQIPLNTSSPAALLPYWPLTFLRKPQVTFLKLLFWQTPKNTHAVLQLWILPEKLYRTSGVSFNLVQRTPFLKLQNPKITTQNWDEICQYYANTYCSTEFSFLFLKAQELPILQSLTGYLHSFQHCFPLQLFFLWLPSTFFQFIGILSERCGMVSICKQQLLTLLLPSCTTSSLFKS